jgi:hypothetical protein
MSRSLSRRSNGATAAYIDQHKHGLRIYSGIGIAASLALTLVLPSFIDWAFMLVALPTAVTAGLITVLPGSRTTAGVVLALSAGLLTLNWYDHHGFIMALWGAVVGVLMVVVGLFTATSKD